MNSNNTPLELSRSKKKVLLVDDLPQVRRDLRQLLELTGLFEIIAEAVDSQEAVRQATRVIILSAYGGAEEIEQASAAGADSFVIKGDRYETLINAILGYDESLYSSLSEKGECI